MEVNNFIDFNNTISISSPFLDGLDNIGQAFGSESKKLEFDFIKREYQERNLNLLKRIQYFIIGIALLIPIVNIVVAVALKYFATQNFETKSEIFSQTTHHTGGGVLPYCIRNGEIYFLLSKEGYGPRKNKWDDFGGGKDIGERAIDTAARECWEESRGILGSEEAIRKKISYSTPIGKRYKMFFLKVDALKTINNENFIERKFRDFCRIEKTAIQWAKADDVFKAAISRSKTTGSIQLDRFFARTLSQALNTPYEKAVLEEIYRKEGLTLKDPSSNWDLTAAAACVALLVISIITFNLSSRPEFLHKVNN